MSQLYFGLFLGYGQIQGRENGVFRNTMILRVHLRRGGLWVCSSAWCEKGIMRRLCKSALRVGGEIKERACVHSFWLTKPLGS